MYILRLQRMLDEAQGKYVNDKISPYTARCQKDVESLSKIGMTPEDISYSLSLPISLVRSHKARIERQNEDRRRFLRTGILHPEYGDDDSAYFAILQKRK